ncbi:MAG: DNA polymerase III subunit gamma/tau [Acidobacteria bacterium]|nr:DNA polymerase III subunit gamma/tau [Acidobacteriota bacterium]
MSDSQVIARKFRPQTFDQMVGQDAIRRTIENSIKANRIHHAYLFAGARGVGKTTTARILAKALNCVQGATVEPCGVCASCVEISASRSIDVMEIDAASNTGVDNVRDVIINTVQIAPARDRYKIFIIDEVHMLSNAAFNALLKTLEEPPPRVAFIMATTELHKVPETILSRCQVFEFRTITLKKIFDQLQHIAADLGVQISEAALLSIARAGEGSMRDAQSALDQVISFAGNEVSNEDVSAALGLVDLETLNTTMRAIGEQDAASLLKLVDAIVTRGYDLRNFCRELMTHIRAILVTKVTGFDAELVQLPAGEGEALVRLAELFSEQDLIRFFGVLTKTEQDIRLSTQPRFHLEIGLMKLLQARRLYLLEDALKQLSELASQLGMAGLTGSATQRGQGGSPAPTRSAEVSGKPSSFSSLKATTEASPLQKALSESKARTPNASTSVRASNVASPATNRPSNFEIPTANREALREGSSADEALHIENPFANQTASPFASPQAKVEALSSPRTATLPAAPAPAATRTTSTAPPPWAEEPPMWNDAYEAEPALPADNFAAPASAQNFLAKLKEQLQANRKMMVLSYLNQAASVRLDGNYLRIVYAGDNGRNKSLVESSNNRRAIEDACKELAGRKITLSVKVDGEPSLEATATTTRPQAASLVKERAEDHPAVRAVTEKFQGQLIEIVKPED